MTSRLKQTPLTCSGHTRPVVHVAFSSITPSGGFYLISACKDGKPMLRNGETGDWIGTFEGHKGAVWGCDLNSDASKAATAAADFTAIIWDSQTGDILHSLAHSHIVKSVNFSTDDNYLLSGSNEKLVRIFDLNNIDSDPIKLKGHAAGVREVAFINDNKWIVSASDDKTIRFWDRSTCESFKVLNFSSVPNSIEVSQDGQILTVCDGSCVSFWDLSSLEKIKEYEIPTKVNSATLHPEGNVFVCGGEDFKMYKYDYISGVEIESFKGHFGPIHCIRFSPDGELYASGSEDGTLRLWQTIVGKNYGLWKCVNPEDITTPVVEAHNGQESNLQVDS